MSINTHRLWSRIIYFVVTCFVVSALIKFLINPALATLRLPLQDVAIVVASQEGDNTTWLEHLSNLHQWLYVSNDASGGLTIPANKGREAMVYLM